MARSFPGPASASSVAQDLEGLSSLFNILLSLLSVSPLAVQDSEDAQRALLRPRLLCDRVLPLSPYILPPFNDEEGFEKLSRD